MVLVIGQNSTWQNTYTVGGLRLGQVNRVDLARTSAAGKGANVVRALAALGKQGFLLAYAGGPNGRKFMEACRADGIDADFTLIAEETRICTTLIEGSGSSTELVEPAPTITESERLAFARSFDRSIGRAGLLVISGTAMAGEREECYLRFVRSAHERGFAVILDSYRTHGRRALDASPEILKINSHELAELTGMPVSTVEERAAGAAAIIRDFGVRWVIITRGAEGAEGFDGARSVAAVPPRVAFVNAIGSGDSFTAGIVSHLVERRSTGRGAASGLGAPRPFPEGADLLEAVRLATAMGTANCMSWKPASIESTHLEWVLPRVEASAS